MVLLQCFVQLSQGAVIRILRAGDALFLSVIARQQFPPFTQPAGNYLKHRPAQFLRDPLSKVGDFQFRGILHHAAVWRHPPLDDLHQGGFPGAVASQQAHPLLFFDLEILPVDQRRTAESDADVLQ